MFVSANQLRQALNSHAFIPFYQPIVNNLNYISGCEVLARWNHPEKGMLNAGRFIESIEANNLVDVLTRKLMNVVLGNIQNVFPPSTCPFLLTLNITLSLVMDPLFRYDLVTLNKRLQLAGVAPVFEITEREDIRDFPGAAAVFFRLAEQGVIFAVDDFGTGYACEALLDATRSAFIKVDRTFTTDPHSLTLRRIMRLARQHGAKVIAEGVESAVQAQWLQAMGVDYLQGYHCGRPTSAEHFRCLLA